MSTGSEWKRAKWGKAAKLDLPFGEWTATKLWRQRIVSDSPAIQDDYIERYRDSVHLHRLWRARRDRRSDRKSRRSTACEPDEYFFVASRWNRRTSPTSTIRAFANVESRQVPRDRRGRELDRARRWTTTPTRRSDPQVNSGPI